jgi:hypothetical protein
MRRALSILGISPPLRGDGVPAIHVSLIGTLRKKRNELVWSVYSDDAARRGGSPCGTS